MNTISVRSYLLRRDGKACFYCGGLMLKPTIEHILSKSLGGSDNTQNLVLACEQCNHEMGNLPVNVKINRAVRYRVE